MEWLYLFFYIFWLAASGFGGAAYWQGRIAQQNEITALNSLSQANWASNKQLEALIASVKAGQRLKNLRGLAGSTDLHTTTEKTLRQVVQRIQERNRLEGHSDSVSIALVLALMAK